MREARTKVTTEARWLRHDTDDPPDDADESYEAFLAAGSPEERDRLVDPADGALIIYTAAFAGLPNGAVLSHTACISQGLVYGHFTGTSGHDVYLNSGPLFHLGTFMHTLATFVFGGTNVFVRRVEGDELCRIISEEGCTGAFLVGPIFEQVLEVNATGTYDLSTLRTASVGKVWDAMTSRDQSQWAAAPGGYGQTEAVGMMTFTCLGLGETGTHGRTSPLLQIRVVDEDDRDVGVGEVGEVATRGPTVMNEYWNRPDENAQRSRNGWHHTNDLGRREADGTITFVGPKGRMIKSAAENIYPVEVERCLAAHDAVADVAIIGVPDAKWVQSVKAIVVVADGASVDARRAHRPLPGAHRVVQEAPHGRVRRRAPPQRLPRRLRRARRAVRGRQLPRRPHPQRMTYFPDGSYRRRLRMTVVDDAGSVEAGLEDDFHHFRVRVEHDGAVVTLVQADARRWPWTTCPDAAGPLHALEGMELSPRCLAVGKVADPKQNCTHMFDLAGLAIAHAARGGPVGTTRQYDIEIPAEVRRGEPAAVTCARDGEPLHEWHMDTWKLVAPEPFASAPWRGGFFRWADETFDADGAEAAIVLRRSCDIGLGRGMDLDAVDRADEMRDQMAGVCFTMQPAQIAVSLRNKGTIRDFDADPDALLRDD